MKRVLRAVAKKILQQGPASDTPVPQPEAILFAPRFCESAIREALEIAKTRFADKIPVVLTDLDSWDDSLSLLIRCDRETPTVLEHYSPEHNIFIYACDIDENGLPFVKRLIESEAKFIPVQSYTPSLYCNLKVMARDVLRDELIVQREGGYLKWGVGTFFGKDQLNLMQAIDMTASLEGSFVEVGCYKGSTSRVAVRYMEKRGIERHCAFIDVFEGFNYGAAESSADAIWYGTHATDGKEAVAKRINEAVSEETGIEVSVHQANIITDPLPSSLTNICLAYVDVDMYEAVLSALEKLSPRIIEGGIIVVEDPGHTPALIGARVALGEFMNNRSSEYHPVYLESGQTYLIKR